MKTSHWAAGVCCVVLGMAALDAVADGPAGISRATVQSFAEPDVPMGNSWLIRQDQDITAILHTVVPPWHTMTLWWVVFNEPENCFSDGGCGADDIFTDPAPAMTSVHYAAGGVAGPGGHLALTARLKANDLSGEVLLGPGLLVPASAEVHLVVRSHGPVRLDYLEAQIGSFAGGCDLFLDPPVIPEAVGACADIQFAIHKP